MRFSMALTALCELLLMYRAFTRASAAAALTRASEVQYLNGTALSEALSAAKADLKGNFALPSEHLNTERQIGSYACARSLYCTAVELADSAAKSAAYLCIASPTTSIATNMADSLYLAFQANNYAWVTNLLSAGIMEVYAELASSGVYLTMLFSIADPTTLLAYSTNTTADGIAQTLASLAATYIYQFTVENESNASQTVVAAVIDTANYDVAQN